MKKIKVAGVPEHFNLPWHLGLEEGAFRQRGIDLTFIEVPEGTGRMCEMLRHNEVQIAVVLTEGIVKDILSGNPSAIVQMYVESPLYWGIHVAAQSPFKEIGDLQNATAAISRFGSGSHLMTYVNADEQNWPSDSLQFEVVHTIEGAVEALTTNKAQYFLWEHFTTKPLVDKGIFRRLGDCPTPWPCFVIAVRQDYLKKEAGVIRHILDVLNVFTTDFKQIPSIDRMLSNRYAQELEDIREWLSVTRWSQDQITPRVLRHLQQQLVKLNLTNRIAAYEELVTNL